MADDDVAKALRMQAQLLQRQLAENMKATDESPAVQDALSRGYVPLAQYRDGQIMEKPATGERVFVSPSFVTSDPEQISGMLEGITPAETQRGQGQRQMIEANPVRARVATAAQGVPFVGAYLDEAAGAIDPAAGERMRQQVGAMQEQRPRETMALEVGGALAATPALLAATPARVGQFVTGGASMAGNVLRGAAVGVGAGAAEGAISGAGRGEEGTRGQTAAQGAAVGGAVGGVLGAAAPAVGAGISAAWQNIKGRSVGQIAKGLNISNDAAKVVRTALENDDLSAAADALRRAGSNSMLADAGPAAQGLLDATVRFGGSAPRTVGGAVTERAEDAGQRMTAVLDDVLGAPEGRGALQRNIRQGTADARSKAYEAAYSAPIDYSKSRGRFLESLLSRVPRSAISQANELMRLEGDQSAQIMAQIADDGRVTYTRLPDVRQLDYIARALGDVSEQQSAKGKLGGTTQLGRATGNLQRQIRQVLRAEVPAYGEALDTAADAISRTRAVETGADVFKPSVTREAISDAMRGASKAEKAAARSGIRSAIDDTLARVNAVASDGNVEIREFQKLANSLRSRQVREKMEAVLGARDAGKVYDELDEAVVSLELKAAIARNSMTAQRQAIQGEVSDITAPNALQMILAGEPINATKRIAQVITGTTPEARTLRQQGIYDEIAQVLVSERGRQAQGALRLVERAMAGDALNETQARVIARALTTSAAAAAYTAATAQAE